MNFQLILIIVSVIFIEVRAEPLCEPNSNQLSGSKKIKELSNPYLKLLEKEFVKKAAHCNKSEISEYLKQGVDINSRVL